MVSNRRETKIFKGAQIITMSSRIFICRLNDQSEISLAHHAKRKTSLSWARLASCFCFSPNRGILFQHVIFQAWKSESGNNSCAFQRAHFIYDSCRGDYWFSIATMHDIQTSSNSAVSIRWSVGQSVGKLSYSSPNDFSIIEFLRFRILCM